LSFKTKDPGPRKKREYDAAWGQTSCRKINQVTGAKKGANSPQEDSTPTGGGKREDWAGEKKLTVKRTERTCAPKKKGTQKSPLATQKREDHAPFGNKKKQLKHKNQPERALRGYKKVRGPNAGKGGHVEFAKKKSTIGAPEWDRKKTSGGGESTITSKSWPTAKKKYTF